MRAKRSLGQNFLHDEGAIERIVGALDLSTAETVVEIGPGRGALTGKLVDRAASVIAVEFDRDMVTVLRERFRDAANLRIVEDDVLGVDLDELVGGARAKLIGNLPYNISTPILQKIIEVRMSFTTIVLMFQREVVDRITAPPGGKDRGFLSVLVEDAFETERLFDVPPGAFRPVPKVWSAVVRLVPKPSTIDAPAHFRAIVSASFAHKRKTLLNNLKMLWPTATEYLQSAGIDGTLRAETLTLEDWTRLARNITEKRPDEKAAPGH